MSFMQERKLYDVMVEKSTEELVDILTNRRDHYRPEAIEAMKHVLKERDVSQEELTSIAEKSKEREQETQNKQAKTRMLFQGPGIIVTVLILLGLFILVPTRGWLETLFFAFIGFGAGHLINYYYFKAKDARKEL